MTTADGQSCRSIGISVYGMIGVDDPEMFKVAYKEIKKWLIATVLSIM